MESAPILLNNAWMGSHIKKAHSIIILGAAGILFLDLIIEVKVFPLLYKGIPAPFEETAKPIGAALLPATFFNILLIAANVFGFSCILHKAGYDLGLIPKTRNDWLDFLVFFIFVISGMATWYFPIFFLPLAIAGLYLLMDLLS